MKLLKYIIMLILLSVMISCNDKVNKISRPMLGTIINLTIMGDETLAAKSSQAAFKEIKRIEHLMSPYRRESEIYKINKFADKQAVKCTGENYSLIKQSIDISNDTGGAFDITFASLERLWNYKRKPFILPDKKSIEKKKVLFNYKNITLNKEKQTILFNKKGVKIGLGGIAKGYAIKCAVEKLKAAGVTSAIVEEGGDLQVIGSKNGISWRTGLIHPRERELILSLVMDDGDSIATSGDYERYGEFEGKRYNHIISPYTGYPAMHFSSVSVISKDPVLSDSYATAFFVMGLDRAKKLLKRDLSLQVIFIDLDMKMYVSKSLKGKVKFLRKMDVQWI